MNNQLLLTSSKSGDESTLLNSLVAGEYNYHEIIVAGICWKLVTNDVSWQRCHIVTGSKCASSRVDVHCVNVLLCVDFCKLLI